MNCPSDLVKGSCGQGWPQWEDLCKMGGLSEQVLRSGRVYSYKQAA